MEWQQYFYFIGITVFVPFWLILFWKKENRKDIIFVGITVGIVATIIEHLYSKLDYWNAIYLFQKFPFEDFYYSFVFGGISAELYEIVLRKRNSLRRMYPVHKSIIIVFALITGFSFIILVNFLKINSTIACIIPPLITGITVGIIRKDLFIYELYNGISLTFQSMNYFFRLL